MFISNFELGRLICSKNKDKYSFLDKNNILWKFKNDVFIGKRSVFTKNFKSCWLEEVEECDIKSWWCGKDSDYNEIFKKKFFLL
jgi:hypothetical protein